jgi:hypothetical protein
MAAYGRGPQAAKLDQLPGVRFGRLREGHVADVDRYHQHIQDRIRGRRYRRDACSASESLVIKIVAVLSSLASLGDCYEQTVTTSVRLGAQSGLRRAFGAGM